MRAIALSIICMLFAINIQAQGKNSKSTQNDFNLFWEQYKTFLGSGDKSNFANFISIPLKKRLIDEDDSETTEILTAEKIQVELASKSKFPFFYTDSCVANLQLEKPISRVDKVWTFRYEIKKTYNSSEYILSISRLNIGGVATKCIFRKINGKYKLVEIIKAYI